MLRVIKHPGLHNNITDSLMMGYPRLGTESMKLRQPFKGRGDDL
jgi:hypothetical protein